jgi:hypothetical protein
MAERYSQLPSLLAQRERAALGLLRNGYDRRLSLGMRFQLAHVFLRPDTPSSHLLFLCHSDSLQFGRGRLSRPWRFTSNFRETVRKCTWQVYLVGASGPSVF